MSGENQDIALMKLSISDSPLATGVKCGQWSHCHLGDPPKHATAAGSLSWRLNFASMRAGCVQHSGDAWRLSFLRGQHVDVEG